MPEHFYPKSPEELQQQMESVSDRIGENIERPSLQNEAVNMPLNEIKERFPKRYEMYLQILRAERSGNEISEEERKKMAIWLKALNSLDVYIESHKQNGEERTLRERQFPIFEDLRNFLEQGGKDGYIKLPTGVGKTVLFAEFLEATNLKALIATLTCILVDQTGKRIEQFAEGLDVGMIYQRAKTLGKQVTITTYASLISQIKRGELKPEDYDCLILDEAHKALGPETQNAIDKFRGSFRIGFTATPDYSQEKKLSNILPTEIHKMDIKEAVEEDLLSSFSVIIAQTETDISGVKIDSNGEYNQKQLEKAINVEARNQSAVELYREMFDGQKAITYCIGIDHAEKVSRLFQDNGISARVISGQNQNEHKEILDGFRSGEIKVLCNANILIEGFDEPSASICLNLRPTASPVVAEQRGGRVLRLDPENPDKHATIVDFFDQGINNRAAPISFADVAGGSFVMPERKEKAAEREEPNSENVPRQRSEIKIEGLRVITDAQEVMRIVHEISEQREGKQKVKEYTREELIRQLQEEAGRLQRPPMLDDIINASQEGRMASARPFQRVFGSWNKALEAAGLELTKNRYTKEDLIRQLQEEAGRLGKTPTVDDLGFSSKEGRTASAGVFYRAFGSWNKAMEAAGLELTKNRYTKEELIRQLQEEAGQLQRTPSGGDMSNAFRDGRTASVDSFQRVFGSWNKALEAAGLEPTQIKYSKDELLKQLKKEAERLKKIPSIANIKSSYKEKITASDGAFKNAFGSWNKALEAAGLELTKNRYTKEDLIRQLQEEAGRLGKTPTVDDLGFSSKEGRTASAGVFYRAFGSWNKAMEAAGLLNNKKDKIE